MSPITAKLQAVAKQMFIANGWEATSARAILKQAKVVQGSFAYAYPKGKRGIGAAIYIELFGEIWGPTLVALSSSGSARLCIREGLIALVGQVERQRAAATLLLQLEEALMQTDQKDCIRAERAKIAKAFEALAVRYDVGGSAQMPATVLYARTFGPLEAFCREWLHGAHDEPPSGQLERLLTAPQYPKVTQAPRGRKVTNQPALNL